MWTYRAAVMRWTFLLHLFVSTLFYFIYWFLLLRRSAFYDCWSLDCFCFNCPSPPFVRRSVNLRRQPVEIPFFFFFGRETSWRHIKFMLWWSSKMRALPSTHLQSNPSWADVFPFTVTTSLMLRCCSSQREENETKRSKAKTRREGKIKKSKK